MLDISDSPKDQAFVQFRRYRAYPWRDGLHQGKCSSSATHHCTEYHRHTSLTGRNAWITACRSRRPDSAPTYYSKHPALCRLQDLPEVHHRED